MLKKVEYKWANLRITAKYTPDQKEALQVLQVKYAEHIKKSKCNELQLLAGAYLETQEDGLPARELTPERMMELEYSYQKTGYLTCYANLLKNKIWEYMRQRSLDKSVYANDPQNLICLQMLSDFEILLVTSKISKDLYKAVNRWHRLLESLITANSLKNPDKKIFPEYESSENAKTLRWLFLNIKKLLSQVLEEIQLELKRCSISDHLDNLCDASKIAIQLSFEYVSRVTTYEKLPEDFNLASFYDAYPNIDFHKQKLQKTWFYHVYKLALSPSIKALLFSAMSHEELSSLLYEAKSQQITLPAGATFLNELGEVNETVLTLFNQIEPQDMPEKTGMQSVFFESENDALLKAAVSCLGHIEIMAQLASLIRIASSLLHRDGSLLVNEETKHQMILFIRIYQTLLDKLFHSLEKIHEIQDIPLKSSKFPAAFSNTPNDSCCARLKVSLGKVQKNCMGFLQEVKSELENIKQRREELDKSLRIFKQEWFGFVNNHGWLLSQDTVLAVGELKKKRVQELEQQKEELEQEKRKLALVEVGQELSPAAHTKVFDKLLMHTTSTTTSISLGANPMCMFSEQKPQPESLETRLKKCLMNLSEEQKPKFITVLGEKIGVNYQ